MSTTDLLSSDYKAPGGKMLRVRLKEKEGRIASAKISGDFFLIPEESLSKLEKMLEDVRLDERELRLLVDRFFRGTNAQGLGVSSDDFVKAILAAKNGG
jgi:lipoate---protein ligase